MKLCDVTQFFSPIGGGVRRYITEKRRYIQEHTDDEHILIIPASETDVIREGRLTLCTIKSPHISRTSRYRALLNLRQVETFLLQEKPDLIESSDPYHLAWKALAVGKELHIPVFGFYHSHFPEAYLRTAVKYGGVRFHNLVMRLAQKYIVRLYNRFHTTWVPSEFLAALLQTWGVANTVPVRLGIDTDFFFPGMPLAITREKINIPDDAFLLLYIGRLAGEKNTQLLLDTFRLLQQECPEKFAFLIIGDGQLRNLVIQARKHLPLLRWIPYCRESCDLADYYRIANLFVHPGVHETFGIVSIESQACGCPVVGIRGSYMDANIFAGHDLWAEENTPEALRDAILRFSKHDTRALGLQASETIQRQFSWDTVFQEMFQKYRAALRAPAV